jgi:tol-pal system protein YbgF
MRENAYLGVRAGPFTRPSTCLLALGALALSFAAGCGHQDTTDRSIEQLRADITRVAADRDRLEERVVALERTEQTRTDAAAQSPAPLPDPPRARADEAPRPEAPRSAKIGGDAKHDFDSALALARSKQFDKAIDGLTAFLVRYPDHEYVDQAMYARGDCLYAKGAHARAAEQLQGLIARFPQSARVPDAMLKLGLSQKRLGADDQAQRTFAELKQRFPKSDAVRQVPAP